MENEYYDLTAPQKSIWLTEQYYQNTNINNVCGTFYCNQPIDFQLLKKSINLFLKNNDSFKIKLKLINGEVKQYFADFKDLDFQIISISSEEEQIELERKLASKTFHMFDSLLFDIIFFKYPDSHGGFVINSHHIISDSWSNGIAANGVSLIYSQLKNHQQVTTNEEFSYKDYLRTESEYINSKKFEVDKKYWDDLFATIPEIATIQPVKNSGGDREIFQANRIMLGLNADVLSSIKEFCKKQNVTLYNFFMCVFSLYLGRVSNLNEFVIGTPILNRTNYKEKRTTGMFVNTLPLKITLDYEKTFLENLKDIAIRSFGMLKHQKYSFQYIIENLRKKDSSLPKLYNVLFSYQITKMNNTADDLNHTITWAFNGTLDDDLDIHMFEWDDEGTLKICYDYRMDLFDEQDVQNIHARIIHIINQLLAKENILLREVEIITDLEKENLLSINNVKVNYPDNLTITSLFQKQVQSTPDNIAISFEGDEITYRDLDKKSDTIASYLIENGVCHTDTVGILLPRSLNYYIAILGIIKTGAKYMPMDIEFPSSRLEYMLKDSKAICCITLTDHISTIKNDDVHFYDINEIYSFDKQVSSNYTIIPTTPCYVIYTSGSTGTPKGVVVSHGNVVNYVYAFQNEFHLNKDDDVVLQQFTPSFDAFVEEFYPALLNGVKIFAVSKNTIYSLPELEKLINKNKITLISCSPLLLNELNKLDNLKTVKTFISGGDVLKKEFFSNLIKHANVYNTYGPTETTVCTTYHQCSPNETGIIPIGHTIANYSNYIVSDDNNLLPKGCIGELCVGGKGVSLGYLNNKKLTNQKFITLFGETVYKTGDLCRINPQNEIEFLGRKDNQLKIRGYRVSLTEIERMLNQYPGISNSVVLTFTDNRNNKKLCAYYVSKTSITMKEIKEYLSKVLPSYMIPSLYIRIDSVPTNINGKIEKKELPNAADIFLKQTTTYVAPSSPLEKQLEIIWKKILGIDKVSVLDNVFDIGADSLSIINFQALTMDEPWKVDAQDIYLNPTIRSLAEVIKNGSKTIANFNEEYNSIDIKKLSIQNKIFSKPRILLTGSTGFLGIHLLSALLENSNAEIYCLVRGKNNDFSQTRLIDLYKFYFGKNLLQYKSRVHIIYGDITLPLLGMSSTIYDDLTEKIDIVIHSAATVKHYGNDEFFEEVNVTGTNNIINFCLKSNSILHYISTMSVSGQFSHKKGTFTENDFFIEQNYCDNVYVKSKFEAEYNILKSIKDSNLSAKIYRVGNLTGRYCDGFFQKNINTNAFYNKLKSIIDLGKAPAEIASLEMDFSPVDLTSTAIMKLILMDNSSQIIYHIYNPYTLSVKDIISCLNKLGYSIQLLNRKDYTAQKDIDSLNELIYDLSFLKDAETIKVSNSITLDHLQKIDFYWKQPDINYLTKIINYMKKVHFLKEGSNCEGKENI